MARYPKWVRQPRKPWRGSVSFPRVVGEPDLDDRSATAPKSHSQRFAEKNRATATKGEVRMREILERLGTPFTEQYILPGGMILDFFLRKQRIGVEVDGAIHDDPLVRANDLRKEEICQENGIFLARFRNREVIHHSGEVERRLRRILEKDLRQAQFAQGGPALSISPNLFSDYTKALSYCKQSGGTLKRFDDTRWIVF